jgi:hypothetical protein
MSSASSSRRCRRRQAQAGILGLRHLHPSWLENLNFQEERLTNKNFCSNISCKLPKIVKAAIFRIVRIIS